MGKQEKVGSFTFIETAESNLATQEHVVHWKSHTMTEVFYSQHLHTSLLLGLATVMCPGVYHC